MTLSDQLAPTCPSCSHTFPDPVGSTFSCQMSVTCSSLHTGNVLCHVIPSSSQKTCFPMLPGLDSVLPKHKHAVRLGKNNASPNRQCSEGPRGSSCVRSLVITSPSQPAVVARGAVRANGAFRSWRPYHQASVTLRA